MDPISFGSDVDAECLDGACPIRELPGADDGEESAGGVRQKSIIAKFLLPNVAAGSLIGKGGACITEVQSQSGTRMQLSRTNEFYPGTMESQDRILVVSGTVDQLLTALHLVLTKLKNEEAAARAVLSKDGKDLVLRMLVHNRLCGTLIGKGGATIRSFNEDSNATFSISAPPEIPGLVERVLRISGDIDELMRAVALVVIKLSENPDYQLLTDANLNYSRLLAPTVVAVNNPPFGPPPAAAGPYVFAPHPKLDPRPPPHHVAITIAVPESAVGSVIGKGGSVINGIKNIVNVNIRISRKGEYLPGTTDRTCELSGNHECVDIARRLIMHKIQESREHHDQNGLVIPPPT